MEVEKIQFSLEMQVLSVETIPAILAEVSKNIQQEKTGGLLRYQDGDEVNWETERHPKETI